MADPPSEELEEKGRTTHEHEPSTTSPPLSNAASLAVEAEHERRMEEQAELLSTAEPEPTRGEGGGSAALVSVDGDQEERADHVIEAGMQTTAECEEGVGMGFEGGDGADEEQKASVDLEDEEGGSYDREGLMAHLASQMEELSTRLVRAQTLAQLHDFPSSNEKSEPPPPLPCPLSADARGGEYLSLEDGAMVSGDSLLVGERRGERYMPISEAAERRWSSLSSALATGSEQTESLLALLEQAQGVPHAWAKWLSTAAERMEAGYDALQQALSVQRQAARLSLDRRVANAEAGAAAAERRLRAVWAAQHQLQEAMRVCSARAAREAGEGWERRLLTAWGTMEHTYGLVTSALGENSREAPASDTVEEMVNKGEEVAISTDKGTGGGELLAVEEEVGEPEPVLRAPRLSVTSPAIDDLYPPPFEFDISLELSLLGECFTKSSESEGTCATLDTICAAQRQTIEKLEQKQIEQRSEMALLKAQLEAANQQLQARATTPHSLAVDTPLSSLEAPRSPCVPPHLEQDVSQSRMQVYFKAGVSLDLLLHWEAAGRLAVQCVVTNSTESAIENVQVMAAVPRYLQVEVVPTVTRKLSPGSSALQPLVLMREAMEKRAYKLKLRLEFLLRGRVVIEDVVSGSLETPPLPTLSPRGSMVADLPVAQSPLSPGSTTVTTAVLQTPATRPSLLDPIPSGPDAGWADFDAAFDGVSFESAQFEVSRAPSDDAVAPDPSRTPPPTLPTPPPTQPSTAPQDHHFAPPPSGTSNNDHRESTATSPHSPIDAHTSGHPSSASIGAALDNNSDWGRISEAVESNSLIARDGLPKSPELIKAEMGIVLGKLGRQVISVSLADDLQTKVSEWCAARSLSTGAQSKIMSELTSRLDLALAQAYQDMELDSGKDVC